MLHLLSTAHVIKVECFLQGQPLLDSTTMTTKTLASGHLTVKGSMSSSRSTFQLLRALAMCCCIFQTSQVLSAGAATAGRSKHDH